MSWGTEKLLGIALGSWFYVALLQQDELGQMIFRCPIQPQPFPNSVSLELWPFASHEDLCHRTFRLLSGWDILVSTLIKDESTEQPSWAIYSSTCKLGKLPKSINYCSLNTFKLLARAKILLLWSTYKKIFYIFWEKLLIWSYICKLLPAFAANHKKRIQVTFLWLPSIKLSIDLG